MCSVTNSLSSRKVRQEVISAAELLSPGGKEAASSVHATYLATSSGVEATPLTTTCKQKFKSAHTEVQAADKMRVTYLAMSSGVEATLLTTTCTQRCKSVYVTFMRQRG